MPSTSSRLQMPCGTLSRPDRDTFLRGVRALLPVRLPRSQAPSRNSPQTSYTSCESRWIRIRASRHSVGDALVTLSRILLRRSVSFGTGQDGGDRPCEKTRVNAASSAALLGFGGAAGMTGLLIRMVAGHLPSRLSSLQVLSSLRQEFLQNRPLLLLFAPVTGVAAARTCKRPGWLLLPVQNTRF